MSEQEAELKQQEEEEESQRQELEAAILFSEQLKKESQLKTDKQLLEAKGIPPSDDGAAVIRFQLPHGIKLSRRFWRTDTISVNSQACSSLLTLCLVTGLVRLPPCPLC
jgi:hypothetical protein